MLGQKVFPVQLLLFPVLKAAKRSKVAPECKCYLYETENHTVWYIYNKIAFYHEMRSWSKLENFMNTELCL